MTAPFYGLFRFADGRRAIAPLVNFDADNEARNFMDELAASR